MKKLSILTLSMVALVGFMAITVWAASPHFINCSASGVNPDGTLNACFKIAGTRFKSDDYGNSFGHC
jgi:hypothetical protein